MSKEEIKTVDKIYEQVWECQEEIAREILRDYANQRVIEELESLEKNYAKRIEGEVGFGMVIPVGVVKERIEELKQDD